MQRIHRCGQTRECTVYHLLAHGSPDWALTKVHEDKLALEKGVVDGDWSGISADKCWRQAGKIADLCSAVEEASGNLVRAHLPPTREGGAGSSSEYGRGGGGGGAGSGDSSASRDAAQPVAKRPALPDAPGPGPPPPPPPSIQPPPPPPPWARPPCKYGASCYQKNPAHLAQFSHPASAAAAPPPPAWALPPCKYGTACYQKNPAHLAQFSHPSSRKRDQPD